MLPMGSRILAAVAIGAVQNLHYLEESELRSRILRFVVENPMTAETGS
jgi:hypothetical protein